jgi:Escherichia/Staphylococcus phage prohead protease
MADEKAVERRFLPLAQSAVAVEDRADGGPQIVGIASVFYDGTPATEYELAPGYVERIMPGAFDHAMQDSTEDTVALFNHNPDNLLGRRSARTLKLSRVASGLQYRVDADSTTVGQDVVKHVKRGDLSGSSFSFMVETDVWRMDGGNMVREIQSVYPLFDVGPVTFPAYKSTSVSARSIDALEAQKQQHATPPKPNPDAELQARFDRLKV